jgi:putative cell wall-binding protein
MVLSRFVAVLLGVALAAAAAGAPAVVPLATHESAGGEDELEDSGLDDHLQNLGLAEEDDPEVHRAGGPDRVTTSVAASNNFREAADSALLATADDFPDALAATALAAQRDAPLLLTHRDRLPEAVASELSRLGVEEAVLLGGTGAISDAVAADLTERGYRVARFAGDTRFATARKLAEAAGPAETGEVVLTLGARHESGPGWPDAVAAGTLAASRDNLPLLLTAHDHLPDATAEALRDLEADRVLVVGGEAAIAPAVMSELEALGLSAERLAGATRYETSARLAREALQRNQRSTQSLVVATGEDFPDALAAGALAGALEAPLVLTPSAELAETTGQFVRDHQDTWGHGMLVGGASAASETVEIQLEAALSGEPRPEPAAESPPEPEDEPEPPEPEDEPDRKAAEADDEVTHTFEGEASWYGSRFHGQQTACDETFNMHAHTAAHRELPCGTRVRVTNTENGRQVVVRINDRGPAEHSRVLDVSRAAAEKLGMRASGTAWVRGEVLAE